MRTKGELSIRMGIGKRAKGALVTILVRILRPSVFITSIPEFIQVSSVSQ